MDLNSKLQFTAVFSVKDTHLTMVDHGILLTSCNSQKPLLATKLTMVRTHSTIVDHGIHNMQLRLNNKTKVGN